ncbi:hypothetical protein SDC9_165834 [bioreactor metagenome]|uniref:NAD-specific glutamate dehydrogenase n=1 Tax=bioreactor metagenome TaxID=1076179 RepID=A0A645G2W6_9ZZZZ
MQERLTDLRLSLLQPGATAQHHVVAVLVELDDLGLEFLAHVGLQVADPAHLDQGGRQEAAQPDVDDKTTLDHLDDGAGDHAVGFLDLLDGAPSALVLGALLGQDQATFLVLLLLDEGFDLVAHLDNVERIDIVLDGQLFGGDDAFSLVADVEEDLVAIDLDDGASDDVSVVEVFNSGIDRGLEGFWRADVVDCDLVRGLSGGGHVVGLRLLVYMFGWTHHDHAASAARAAYSVRDDTGRNAF